MKVNKLDLIYKKLIELDSNFNSFKIETTRRLINIESRLDKIEKCPTIQKEIEK